MPSIAAEYKYLIIEVPLHKSYDAWSHLYSWHMLKDRYFVRIKRAAEPMDPIIEVATSLQVNYAPRPSR